MSDTKLKLSRPMREALDRLARYRTPQTIYFTEVQVDTARALVRRGLAEIDELPGEHSYGWNQIRLTPRGRELARWAPR